MRFALLIALGLAGLPAHAAGNDGFGPETDRLVAATAELFDVLEGGKRPRWPRTALPEPVTRSVRSSGLSPT